MLPWDKILRVMADNLAFVVSLAAALAFSAGWLVIEGVRGRRSRSEVHRLRRRIDELERERFPEPRSAPAVLSPRALRPGSAATTSDGGCLVLLEKISPALKAEFTVRVDGDAVLQHHAVAAGEQIQVSGKCGEYVVTIHGVDRTQAQVGIVLRPGDVQARSAPTR